MLRSSRTVIDPPVDGRERPARRSARVRRSSLLKILTFGLLCGTLLILAAPGPSALAAPGDVNLSGSAQKQVDSLSAKAEALQAQIAKLDRQLEQNTEAYNRLSMQLDEISLRLLDLRRQGREAEREYQKILGNYEDRLCELYKTGSWDAFLALVLDADGVDNFLERSSIAAQRADQDRRLLGNLERSTERLDALLIQEDEAKSQELAVRKQLADVREQITTGLATRQEKLASVDAQIAAIIEAERKRQAAEQERLRQALANLLNNGQVYDGVLPQTDDETVNQFLYTAAAYIGIPYVWGGDRPSTGMDCSGYTQFVYKQHGVSLPHYSGYQAQMGIPVDYANIRPADLLAFGFPVHHVGIYIGEDLFLHAAGTGTTIKVGRLSDRDDVAAIRRFDLKPRSGKPAWY